MMCEQACCHGGETNCFSSTCLDVCAECPPLATSKPHSKTCHWQFDQGYKFLVDNALDIEKNNRYGHDIAANLTWFFQPRWIWRFPLWRLLLNFRVITIHPCFITSYDIGYEVGVVSGLLFEFPADRNAKGLLVVTQQSWHKSHRNASLVQIVRQNALNGPVWQSYYLTNIMDSLPKSARTASQTFAMFSGVALVDGHPERLSSTEVRPSLKRLYHKKVCFGSWHYLWRLPVAFGGFLEQFF